MQNDFEIEFYETGSDSPIVEFLDNCGDNLRSKILRQIKYVHEFGLTPQVPNIKKVAGTNFWELRVLGKDNIRLFCIRRGKIIHVVHIFVKKKQKTPNKDIEIAERRIGMLDN